MVSSKASGGGSRAGDPVTVYVLDRDDNVRAALLELIDGVEGLQVVGSSGSFTDALAAILQLRPRVAVTDGLLHDGTGWTSAERCGPCPADRVRDCDGRDITELGARSGRRGRRCRLPAQTTQELRPS